MKRLASSVLRDLEIRVANLEKQASRPSMSPRRLIDEGMFEMREDQVQKDFKLFDLNDKSILKFVKDTLNLHDSGERKVVYVSVNSYDRFEVDIFVKTITYYPSSDTYGSYSFDATLDGRGNVKKIVPDEEHDLTYAQYSRLERRPVQVSYDYKNLQRAFPGYIFNK